MTRHARLPKYLAIYDDLRTRVESGEWQDDKPLPAQRDLAASYGVTIMTLRQALHLLETDGLIELRPGSGTFSSNHQYTYDLLHLAGFAADLTAQGAAVETHVLDASEQLPPRRVARALQVDATRPVLTVTRRRVIDTRRVVLQYSYVPAHVALDHEKLISTSLYRLLAEHGYPIAAADESITFATLGTAEAELLSRPPNSPAMLSQRTSITSGGFPILHDTSLIPADIAEVQVSRGRERVQVKYRISELLRTDSDVSS